MVKGVGVLGKSWGWWLGLYLLIAGIVLPQVWVFGGALSGRTVLLPLDSFVWFYPGFYWESTPGEREAVGPPRWPNLGDHLLQHEPYRRFAVQEIHAGRVPGWNPAGYGGAPFIGSGQSAVFSPYRLIEFLSMDPVVLAWSQLARALVAGLGMYCFLRFGLRLSWFAAAAGAWFYPWTGFMTVWFAMPIAAGATWMGWVLLATEKTVRGRKTRVSSEGGLRRPGWRWPVLLGVFLCFTIFAGHPQIAGHMLLMSGVYAMWRVGRDYWKRGNAREAGRRIAWCVFGWALGASLAAVQLLPMVVYALNSERGAMRMSGAQERPAQGAWALGQMVQPWIAGEISPSSVYLLEGNRQESGAAGYAGLLVMFVLVPLAWRLKRWRSEAWLWGCVVVLGMSAVAGIPVLEQVMRMWPLGVLSSNRLTCLTAFAVVVLGAMGVNAVTRPGVGTGGVRGKLWMLWVGVILAVVCLLNAEMGELRTRLAPAVASLTEGAPRKDVEALSLVLEEWFERQFMVAMGLAVVAAGLYAALARPGASAQRRRVIAGVVVMLGVGEMVFMAGPAIPQAARKWYPDAPELMGRLKEGLEMGRVVGVDTFEPNVGMWWGVDSATGYDALDPVDVTELMLSATDRPGSKPYAKVLNFEPSGRMGVLKAMNVRYLVTLAPRVALGEPVMSAERFYVYELAGAMARAYVPKRVRSAEPMKVLEGMNEAGFDPREEGWVSTVGGTGKAVFDDVAGTAVARTITPMRVEVATEMVTPGIVVLADAYAPSWKATYNGAPVEILKVNYALRGVVVPAGKGTVVFEYVPWDLRWGFGMTCGSLAVIFGFGVWRIKGRWGRRVCR